MNNTKVSAVTDIEALLRYIKETWGVLTRSNDNLFAALGDDKLDQQADSNNRTLLYIPQTEKDVTVMQTLEKSLKKGNLQKILLEELPKKYSSIKEHGLLYLPHPYIVPGGRFNEQYGWDSYWVMLGLLSDGRVALAKNMVDNFLYEVKHYGFVLNANRTYYLSRSQPPFLAHMVRKIFDETGDLKWMMAAMPYVVQNYQYWMNTIHLTESTQLSRYRDSEIVPAPEVVAGEQGIVAGKNHYDIICEYLATHTSEQLGYDRSIFLNERSKTLTAAAYRGDRSVRESGFDISNRFGAFSLDITSYNPICLNALLYQELWDIGYLYDKTENREYAALFTAQAELQKTVINRYLWDDQNKLYGDYNFRTEQLRLYPFLTAFYPLWVGVASDTQAKLLVKTWLEKFECPGGLVTSLETTGLQWDAPFGWAPLQMIVVEGLRRYGFHREAERIAVKFLSLIFQEFIKTGTVVEKYDMEKRSSFVSSQITAGYNTNEVGFGWTNATFLVLWKSLSGGAKNEVVAMARANLD